MAFLAVDIITHSASIVIAPSTPVGGVLVKKSNLWLYVRSGPRLRGQKTDTEKNREAWGGKLRETQMQKSHHVVTIHDCLMETEKPSVHHVQAQASQMLNTARRLLNRTCEQISRIAL